LKHNRVSTHAANDLPAFCSAPAAIA
jgi:hypothetical protein